MAGLSVIVPTLNEARSLPLLLADLRAQGGCNPEIVVADGGSTDGTAEAVSAGGALLVCAAPGRGVQMNAGANRATGEFLLFLHADSRLPDPALLRTALDRLSAECVAAGSHRVAGHFSLRFERSRPGHDFVFQYLEAKTALNRYGTINGDQGFLLPAAYFRELGGFDMGLPFLEDQRLAERIFASGRWIALPGELVTSARRFETEGVRERLSLMALLMSLHASGADEVLAEVPGIYASQDRAAPLQLRAFHRRIRRSLWARRWQILLRVLYRTGRYGRRNLWQLAFRRDVRRGGRDAAHHHPALDAFDRRLAPWLDNAAMDAAVALAAGLWLFAWTPLTGR